MADTDFYDATFYDIIRPGIQKSAQAVVPHLIDHWYPVAPGGRVLDVGCGEGWWALEFHRRGCKVMGVDNGPQGGLALPRTCYATFDLAAALKDEGVPGYGNYDLAVCLEVAEHLPSEAAVPLVGALCAAAPVVLFSAAVPGQPGAHHINCQWQDYWAGLFNNHGYLCNAGVRWQLWNDQRIEWWYRQNMFMAWLPGVLPHDEAFVHAVIHPDHWQVR